MERVNRDTKIHQPTGIRRRKDWVAKFIPIEIRKMHAKAALDAVESCVESILEPIGHAGLLPLLAHGRNCQSSTGETKSLLFWVFPNWITISNPTAPCQNQTSQSSPTLPKR